MIYFDHAATTPPHPEVIEAVCQVMKGYYGNPSSIHHIGLQAERLLQRARQITAEQFKVKPESIIFTSGGTESNNAAIKGVAYQYQSRGRHLITSTVEHASVHQVFQQLERVGFEITYVPVDESGLVNLELLRSAIRDDTILVSMMYVNNETGAIQPIQDIADILTDYPKIIFHVDAVQAIGKIPVLPARIGIDLFSASAHKFHGPKGIGLLYRREGLVLEPLLAGGGQESGFRSGTENVPLIVGMSKALRLCHDQMPEHMGRVRELYRQFVDGIRSMPEFIVNSPAIESLAVPHIVNISFVGMKSEVVVHALEEHGICISTRSACTAAQDEPSRVLQAMGLSEERSRSGLRICLSPQHTEEDIQALLAALAAVSRQLSLYSIS